MHTETAHLTATTLLQRLDEVLRTECPYVDREALGHWCGLNRPWWQPHSGYGQTEYWRLLKQLQANEVPNIALRIANRSRLEDIGILGYAMLSSPTLEKGLNLLNHLAGQSFPYLTMSLSSNREHALLSCQIQGAGADYFQLLTEEWMVSIWRHIQVLLPEGLAACASYATLNYRAPTYHWQYQQALGCHVAFDQPAAILAIPKQWLYIGIQGRNTQAQALYDTQIKRLLKDHQHSDDIVSRVKRLLVQRPGDCDYHLDKTAPLLSLSPRTLRRYLADAGTSFRQVCLDVRMELAKDYLLESPLTAQEIAYQLGYSQANNFYRAFKHYTGLPPERFRHQQNAH